MFKHLQSNKSVVIVAVCFLSLIPQSMMAAGGEPEVSINKWSIIALLGAACLGYRLTKK